jgi:hypothetical protein
VWEGCPQGEETVDQTRRTLDSGVCAPIVVTILIVLSIILTIAIATIITVVQHHQMSTCHVRQQLSQEQPPATGHFQPSYQRRGEGKEPSQANIAGHEPKGGRNAAADRRPHV